MAPPGSRRQRAPTITIDTTAAGESDEQPAVEDAQLDSGSLSPHGFLSVPMGSDASRTAVNTPTDAIPEEEYHFDENPLKPDKPGDTSYYVSNNKLAFTPGELSKMYNPKNPSAFRELGGLAGLEKGLRTDIKSGLSVDERGVEPITFAEATGHEPAYVPDSKEPIEEAPTSKGSKKDVTRIISNSSISADTPYADRLHTFSDNRTPERKQKGLFLLMWMAYKDKVLIMLSVAAVISLALGIYQSTTDGTPEWVEGVAILIAIVIVTVVGGGNDWQKERQFAKLNKKKEDRKIKVRRSGQTREISIYDIVVGDVVLLEQGDVIPVDGIYIGGHSVTCDESSATGESDLLKKTPASEFWEAIQNRRSLRKLDPFIISGSKVTEGFGECLCTATGIHSSYGKILMSLQDDDEATPLQMKLNVLATYIAKLGFAAAILYFVVTFIEFLVWISPRGRWNGDNAATKGQYFLNIFVTAVSVIVVAVPEGLPLAVTLALAFATNRMTKDNCLVRVMKSCETMGVATTICSDKTGTLTQNVMTVVAGFIGRPSTRFGIDSTAKNLPNAMAPQKMLDTLDANVKDIFEQSIALNTTAFEDENKEFVGSKTETALLQYAREYLGMGSVTVERSNYEILQLIPFNSSRKCMGVVVKIPGDKTKYRLYVKGAPEIVIGRCRRSIDPTTGKTVGGELYDDKQSSELWKLILAYASGALRTLAFAYREFESWPPEGMRQQAGEVNEVEVEDLLSSLDFLGVVGIQDPLRPNVRQAVDACKRAGVFVRMVTGDNIETAKAIALDCGILTERGIALEGPEFRKMSKVEQDEIVPRLQLLARSSPDDKKRLVERLKKLGQVVAVTGDGTNDAPALKRADVGFSMGIAGTEVAKEASEIILMDDNFTSIVKALMWGRAVNDAVKKFLQFQVTVNIAAVIITFVSGVSGKQTVTGEQDPVLSPVQLLWLNLIMDTMAALALATDPPADSILDNKPAGKNSGLITVTMWKMIIGQAIYQMVVVFILYFGGESILSYQTEHEKAALQTLIFNIFVWMQIFNTFNNRRLDNRFNIFEGVHRNWLFILMVTIMCGMQVLIVFVGGRAFQIPATLNGAQWAYSIVLGFLTLPIGVIIRLIPDELVAALVPLWFKRMVNSLASTTVPGDEEMAEQRIFEWNAGIAEARNELSFLKKYKGGRLNNLQYKIKHPRDMLPARPSSTRQSSNRSRSSTQNSTLQAAVVAGGVVAGSIGGWSPIERPSSAVLAEEKDKKSVAVVERKASAASQSAPATAGNGADRGGSSGGGGGLLGAGLGGGKG